MSASDGQAENLCRSDQARDSARALLDHGKQADAKCPTRGRRCLRFDYDNSSITIGRDPNQRNAPFEISKGNKNRRNAAMTDSPLRAKGRAMRRNLMGAAYADKLNQQLYTDPIMEKFAAVTQEAVFGTLWTRPGLDLKTRTLICVISDTATGRAPELKLHIRFARNHGWAEDELVEAILHLVGYVGAPLVREALLVARETFAEMRAEKPVTS